MSVTVVIAGGGQAGFQCASSLRQSGFEGTITLVSAEDRLPYQRPPLSKTYIKDDKSFDSLILKPESFFQKNAIDVRTGTAVAAIDRAARMVTLSTGERLDYGHLVLATGARNRSLPVAGADLSGVHQLRGVDDAEAMRAALKKAERIAIVGAGFIGLEVAASARSLGKAVTVVEAADRLMGRTVSSEISAFFLKAHRSMGTEVRLSTPLEAILGDGIVAGIGVAGGEEIAADLVLIAAGVLPDDELAKAVGLETANGVLVDTFMTTSDPAIFAIGDCAAFESRFGTDRVRLESVQNAIDQAKCVAARIMGGDTPYDSVPWFWSDQGSYKLQIVGLTAGADHVEVVRPQDGRLIAYCFKGEQLLGIETVNRPGEHMLGRRILANDLTLAKAEVAADGFDLKAHVAALMQAG